MSEERANLEELCPGLLLELERELDSAVQEFSNLFDIGFFH